MKVYFYKSLITYFYTMKKIMAVLIILMCFSLAFSTPEVSISQVTVSDASISSGESGSISFTITNTGDRDITNVNVRISSQLGITNTFFSFSDFEIGESRYVSTTYNAPVNMETGSYSILISVDYNIGDAQYSNQAGSVIRVSGSKYLVVSNYTTNLFIDEVNPFSITLKNEGDDELTDVLLELILPDGFIPTTGSQFYVESLSVGEQKIINMNIFVEKSIEPDSFQFTIEKSADSYSDNDILNMVINGVPFIAFSGINLDPEIPVSGTMQTISVQFENTGSGDAYNVVASLVLEQDVVGVTTEYLGTLEREDLTSAIFDIYTPNSDGLTGFIQLNYTNADGEDFVTMQSIDFDVIQSNQTSTTTIVIVVIVVGVIGYLVYKRYFSKKKK